MSQPPTPYARSWSFTNFSTSNPTTPHQGQKIDLELNNAMSSLNATISRLNEVQADDGKIRNSALNITTIAQAVEPLLTAAPLTSINAAGATQVGLVNTAGSTQVSAVTAAGTTQLAALNAVINSANAVSAQNAATDAWYSAYAADTWQQYAATYRDQALASKNAAAQSAADASLYRNNSLAYANAAQNSRVSAEFYAGQAALEASASNVASTNAEASKMAALDAQAQAQAAASAANASEVAASLYSSQAQSAANSFNLSIGQVYSGPVSSATIYGTAPNYILDLTLEAGSIGPAGAAGQPGQTGATGATGATGPAGPGVAAGGTTGQALVKASNGSYDTTWATIQTGDKYLTTSTTSLTIDNNNKSLTVGTGLAYTPQQDIVIAYDASNHMHCLVVSYNSSTGALVADVQTHTGSGTYSSWTVNVGGTTTAVLPTGGTTAQILQKSSNADFDVSWTTPYAGADALKTANNLSELTATAATARANLGLGTMATASAASYALLASPVFSGSPSLPTGTIGVTQSAGTNNTSLATTSFVTTAVSTKANTASPTFTGTVTIPSGAVITGYALLASPSFTGVPTAPTAATSTNTTQIATTAYVKNQGYALTSFVQANYATTTYVNGTFVMDAPSDGNEYVRKNAAWSVATGGGGGVQFPAYDNGITYTVGSQVKYQYRLWEMTTAVGAAGYDPVGNPSYWTEISPASGGVTWGSISGTVSNQTDLTSFIYGLGYQTALDVSTYATANFYPLASNPSGYLTDAPSDGNQYARQNGAWAQVTGGGGGGGSVAWGGITGTVTNQGDLVTYIAGQNFLTAPNGMNDVSASVPYTLAAIDANRTVLVKNINYANVIIIPDDASHNFPLGTVINIALFNCQYVSILSGNYGVAPMVNASNQSNGSYGVSSPYTLLRAIKLAADEWILA